MEFTKKDYVSIAIDTVLQWCKESGVKMTEREFNYNADENDVAEQNKYRKERHTSVVVDWNVRIKIYKDKDNKWTKKLLEKEEHFLNYINCRTTKEYLLFAFTFKELEFIHLANGDVGDGEYNEKVQKIIEKINKLLALADFERNPSESEAISASLKVQRLLAEYNLTMDDVNGVKKNTKENIEQAVSDVGVGSPKENWRFSLANAVGDGYRCKVFASGSSGKENKSCVFYGFKTDALLARRVFNYLFNVAKKLGNQYANQNAGKDGFTKDILYKSFVMGFANGVDAEFQKQCTALAIVCQPEVENEWEKLSKNMGKMRSRRQTVDFDAYDEGIVEGKRALNGQYIE